MNKTSAGCNSCCEGTIFTHDDTPCFWSISYQPLSQQSLVTNRAQSSYPLYANYSYLRTVRVYIRGPDTHTTNIQYPVFSHSLIVSLVLHLVVTGGVSSCPLYLRPALARYGYFSDYGTRVTPGNCPNCDYRSVPPFCLRVCPSCK